MSFEILREEFLAPLGFSAHALAMELKVPAPRINEIVRERRAVTPDTALRLSRYFGTTAQFWLNLQTSYDLKIAEKAVGSKTRNSIAAIDNNECTLLPPLIGRCGAVEKRSSAVLRCKRHRSTYIYIRLAVRFFARLASEHC